MSDPGEQLGEQQDPGNGAAGDPDPAAALEASEKRNVELREEMRQMNARTLGATHGLTPTQIDLLSQQPRDKQEDLAKKLGEETKAIVTGNAAQAAAPAVEPAKAAEPKEPANTDALAGMQSGGEGAAGAKSFQSQEEQMNADIAEAARTGDWDRIKQIQAQAQERAREADNA